MPDNRRPEEQEAPELPEASENTDLFAAWKQSILTQRKFYEDKIANERITMKRYYERKLAEQALASGRGDYRNWRGTPAPD